MGEFPPTSLLVEAQDGGVPSSHHDNQVEGGNFPPLSLPMGVKAREGAIPFPIFCSRSNTASFRGWGILSPNCVCENHHKNF